MNQFFSVLSVFALASMPLALLAGARLWAATGSVLALLGCLGFALVVLALCVIQAEEAQR